MSPEDILKSNNTVRSWTFSLWTFFQGGEAKSDSLLSMEAWPPGRHQGILPPLSHDTSSLCISPGYLGSFPHLSCRPRVTCAQGGGRKTVAPSALTSVDRTGRQCFRNQWTLWELLTSAFKLGLPDLANKNTGCPIEFEFQINYKYVIYNIWDIHTIKKLLFL